MKFVGNFYCLNIYALEYRSYSLSNATPEMLLSIQNMFKRKENCGEI